VVTRQPRFGDASKAVLAALRTDPKKHNLRGFLEVVEKAIAMVVSLQMREFAVMLLTFSNPSSDERITEDSVQILDSADLLRQLVNARVNYLGELLNLCGKGEQSLLGADYSAAVAWLLQEENWTPLAQADLVIRDMETFVGYWHDVIISAGAGQSVTELLDSVMVTYEEDIVMPWKPRQAPPSRQAPPPNENNQKENEKDKGDDAKVKPGASTGVPAAEPPPGESEEEKEKRGLKEARVVMRAPPCGP
jgi:hypothetical protein